MRDDIVPELSQWAGLEAEGDVWGGPAAGQRYRTGGDPDSVCVMH